MNDDGELSETSNEEAEQMARQAKHEGAGLRNRPAQRSTAQQYQLTSADLTNTEAEGEYGGEEDDGGVAGNDDPSSSDLSSATESVRNLNEVDAKQKQGDQRYPKDRHRDNPLFRSDAFDQMPS